MDRPFPAYKGTDPYIFVSYAHADAEAVYPEMLRLRSHGFNIWYDEGINPGSTWRDEVALALTQSRVFLYFISANSVGSENCHQELNFALSRERKVLAVHLEPTELPMGLELSLSNKQAIIKTDHAEAAYQQKLHGALQSMLPQAASAGARAPAPATPAEPDFKSIAILPFTNRSSDDENQYLCDGLAEELIGGLSKIDDLHVAAQLSTFALKNQNLDIETIGKKLRVHHILSGSVQKSANRVRVNVSLNDVRSGHTVWSERYDGTLDDVFELQENVARKIVTALQVELGAQQKTDRLINVGTLNPQAYDQFLLAQHAFGQLTQRSLALASDYFRKAADLDPAFGRAHWMRMICCIILMRDFGAPADELLPRAKAAIAEMETTPFVAPAPRVRVQRWLKEVRNTERELAFEAIGKIRYPDPTWNHYQFWQIAQCLGVAGLVTGAIDYIKRYLALAPQHIENSNVGTYHTALLELAGRLEEAIEVQGEYIAGNPNRPLSFGTRIMYYSRTGQYARAERDLRELSRLFPRNFAQFYHLYWTGQTEAAKEYYAWLQAQPRLQPLFKYWSAFLMGHIDKGMDQLETVAERDGEAFTVKVTAVRCMPPTLVKEVWGHPRHKALMARYGVTDGWPQELLEAVNELTPTTGITVRPDEF